MRFEQSLAKVYIQSYSSLYISGMSRIVNESDMDGVIMVSAAQVSQYANESQFKYRSHSKNRI